MTPNERAVYLVRQFDYDVKHAIECVDQIMRLPVVWFSEKTSLEDDHSDTLKHWVETKIELQSF